MYLPMHLNEGEDASDNIAKLGVNYYLEPVDYPMHNFIFRSRQRSCYGLPLRLFGFDTMYCYEKSGKVHGLTRVHGLIQDNSCICYTHEQMKDELIGLLTFVLNLLEDFGLTDFYLELSTKDPNKHIGSDGIWEEATNTLARVAKESNLEPAGDPRGAALYGPKISVQTYDTIGRT